MHVKTKNYAQLMTSNTWKAFSRMISTMYIKQYITSARCILPSIFAKAKGFNYSAGQIKMMASKLHAIYLKLRELRIM